MSTRPRWGILATGGIARAMTGDLLLAGHTVTAVGSRRPEASQAFAAEFGIANAHGSYEALVADPEVDVVYVATPHSHHAANAILAIEAGKHVLVEKAFTLTQAEAQRVADAAEQAGVVVMEAMWTRFLPHMVRLREILASGILGEVRTVLADHTQALPTNPEHRLQNPELGGGALLDLGIYPVAFAVDVLGMPQGVHAHAALTPTGVDRQTAMILDYADGRQAVLHTALDTAGPNRAAVIGTEGSIEIDRTFYVPTSFTVRDRDWNEIERFESDVEGRGMQFQAAEMERRIAGEAASSLPLDETVAIMSLLDEVRRQIGVRYAADDA
ncbi:Gfo/Idh/MocA family protein [Microcella flavibacter]|uniref:Gfo/Idh/MocA family protein n=1 Tax=Microcella flavibacter TaxID=1804990 RepID=UPI001456F5B0|nr:Gfo/Idh/MocA family oxidoreductase [Microcella flavibacter]